MRMTLNNLFCWSHSHPQHHQHAVSALLLTVLFHHVSTTKQSSTIVLQNKKRKLQTIYIHNQVDSVAISIMANSFTQVSHSHSCFWLFIQKITAHLPLFESSHSEKTNNPPPRLKCAIVQTVFKMSIRILKALRLPITFHYIFAWTM